MREDLLWVDCMWCNFHFLHRIRLINNHLYQIRIPSIPNTHLSHCFLNRCFFNIRIMNRLDSHISQSGFQFKILLIAHCFHMHSLDHLFLLILLRSLHPLSVHQSWLHDQVILRNSLLHLFRFELLCLHHRLLLAPMLQINLRTPLLMLIHDLSVRLPRTHQPCCQRPMPHIRHLHLVSFQLLLLLIHLLQMIL